MSVSKYGSCGMSGAIFNHAAKTEQDEAVMMIY